MAEGKKPVVRRCCGCMQHFEKRDLVRVVRTPEGAVVLDESGRQNGRGAYVCKTPDCVKKLRKNRRVEQSLKSPVPEEIYRALEEAANGN